jgi:hypothetical protein
MIIGISFSGTLSKSSDYDSEDFEKIVEKNITIPLDFPSFKEFKISIIDEYHLITHEDFSMTNIPGKPQLPEKNYIIYLPNEARKISLEFHDNSKQIMQGRYKLLPSSRIISLNGSKINENYHLENIWIGNFLEIYKSNSQYPEKMITKLNEGTFRNIYCISISVCPFLYYPESESLVYINSGELKIRYEIPKKIENNDCFEVKIFDDFTQLKKFYYSSNFNDDSIAEQYDYFIITTDELIESISSSSFISWKNFLGYKIKIYSISDEIISQQIGDDLPQKIRNFLRENYQQLGTKYVLIVGDHETIPMRYCYPDPQNHRFDLFDWTSGEVPTDYYYADLSLPDSESWDQDGDGYFGEFNQDSPDFMADVYVGRIPTSNPSRVTYTLNKIVRFEGDTSDWKQNALHAGAFFYFTNEENNGWPAMDGAESLDYFEKTIMQDWTISHYSEQSGLETSSIKWPALTLNSFIDDWRTGKYAIVNWQGHGWTNGVSRKIWINDDGDEVPEANEMSWKSFINVHSDLDDDYPSIVTAVSCYVGCPEKSTQGNLGIKLLTNPNLGAAVGVVASARSPYGEVDWPANMGGSDSIMYELNKNIIHNNKSLGDALYESKYFCTTNYGWNNWIESHDMFTFNLFGDPSMLLAGISTTPPTIQITKPKDSLYLGNNEIMPFSLPLIFGKIDIEVEVSENVNYVEFYIDEILKATDNDYPFSYTWTDVGFFQHTIKTIAYDSLGLTDEVEKTVSKFF